MLQNFNEGEVVVNTITDKMDVVVDVLPQNKYLTVPLKGEESPTQFHASWIKSVRKVTVEDRETADLILAAYRAEKEQRNGLYDKYTVIRTSDSRESPTAMFVLDRRDPAAFMALSAYAKATSSYQLKRDIIKMMEELLEKNEFKWSKAIVVQRAMEIELGHLKVGD